MAFAKIDPKEFEEKIFKRIGEEWFLLTAGTERDFNTMTAAWGSLGFLWGKNVATVYVRKSRYTHDYMDAGDVFTMSFFDPSHRETLNFCGSRSGREVDKAAACGLTPVVLDGGVAFEEAELILACRKIHREVLLPECFLDPSIERNYRGADAGDYHTMYIGEVLGIYRK